MSSTRFDEDIWLLQRVSLGANFELFLAFWPEENDKVLIKKVRDDIDPQRKSEAEARLLKEAETLEEFWSPYFPKVYDIRRKPQKEDQGVEGNDGLYLIIQYFAGVSLREYLNIHMEKKTISFYFIQNFINEMDHALAYLHQKKGIVHLDISPDNIIVTSDNKVKIIDFEDSRKAGEKLNASKLRGKEKYLSPGLLTLIQQQHSGTFEPRWDNYAYAKTLQELCEQTRGVDRLKTYSLKNKIRSLKSQHRTDTSRKRALPSVKFPILNLKYIMVALSSFAILALTVLGLKTLGRPHTKRAAKVSGIHSHHRVLKNHTTPKKGIKRKSVRTTRKLKYKVNRRPSLPARPKIVTSTGKSKPQRIVKIRKTKTKAPQLNEQSTFRETFRKLISKKAPFLKECMSYENSGYKGKLALSFRLKSTKGRAQAITFDDNDNLNNLTKSCLAALYADIIFPQHPSQQEVQIVQHFTFSQKNPSEDSLFL